MIFLLKHLLDEVHEISHPNYPLLPDPLHGFKDAQWSLVNICLQIHFISSSHQGTDLQEAECSTWEMTECRERYLDLPFPAGVLQAELGCFSQSCTRVPCLTPLPWYLKVDSGSSSPSQWILVTWTAAILVKMGVFFPPTSCSQMTGSLAVTELDGAAEGDKKPSQEMQSFIPSWNLQTARAGKYSCEGKLLRF